MSDLPFDEWYAAVKRKVAAAKGNAAAAIKRVRTAHAMQVRTSKRCRNVRQGKTATEK